jgi:hypothetical protein
VVASHHYPFAVFIHILGALGLFVALALEWLAASAVRRRDADHPRTTSVPTLSIARRIGALSMAFLVVPGLLMALTRWNFLAWPAAGLIGMAMMMAVGLLLSRRPALQLQSVQIRIAIALGVVAVRVFKLDLLTSLVIVAAATVFGIGATLISRGGPQNTGSKLRAATGQRLNHRH